MPDVGSQQTGDDAQQRALADAGRALQRHDLAGADVERGAVEHRARPEPHDHVHRPECGDGVSASRASRSSSSTADDHRGGERAEDGGQRERLRAREVAGARPAAAPMAIGSVS